MFNLKFEVGRNVRPATNQYAHSTCSSARVFCHICFNLHTNFRRQVRCPDRDLGVPAEKILFFSNIV